MFEATSVFSYRSFAIRVISMIFSYSLVVNVDGILKFLGCYYFFGTELFVSFLGFTKQYA
jgi:uncharacterized protein (DUF2235 family)